MFDRFLKIIMSGTSLIVIPTLFLFPFIIWSEIRNLLIDVDYIGQLIASGEEDKFVGLYLIFLYLVTIHYTKQENIEFYNISSLFIASSWFGGYIFRYF